MNRFRKRVGLQLRKLRLEQGLDIEEVALRMGSSRSPVHRLENGRHDPKLTTIWEYAIAIGVDPVQDVIEPAERGYTTDPRTGLMRPTQMPLPIRTARVSARANRLRNEGSKR